MPHSRFTPLALAGAIAATLVASAPAYAWDSLTVFGDSLSDGGNVGRFTYDGAQHPLYDEILAADAGLSLRPSSQGGSNYAQGGAVTVPALNPAFNTQDQLARWLQRNNGRAERNGLYIYWAGANDIAAAVLANPLTAPQTVAASASAAAAQVRTLLDAGAGTVIVPNVPQLGTTPLMIETVLQLTGSLGDSALQAAFQSLNATPVLSQAAREQAIQTAFSRAAGEVSAIPAVRDALAQQLFALWQVLSEQVTALSDGFNQQEEAGLAALKGNIVRADIAGLLSEVIADPARYGLSNTIGMACPPGTSAAQCTSATPGFSEAQRFLFADRLHPSPAVHAMIADYIRSILDAPALVSSLTAAPAGAARDMQNTLEGHLQQQRQQAQSAGEFSLFGGYAGQHADYRRSDMLTGDATQASLTLGMGYQLTDSWQAGLVLSRSDQRQHPDDRYSFKMRGNLVALYSQLTLSEQGWINADVHYGDLSYDAIERRIPIGPATRTEQGSSSGKLLGFRVQSGWDFPLTAHLSTGPVVRYALDYARAGGYRENGESSTAMRFSDQTRHTQTGAAGWRIDTARWPVNPWAEISYNRQFGDAESSVRGGLKSTRTAFTRTVSNGDDSWLEAAAGASVPLTDAVSAFTGVSAIGGNSDRRQITWNIGINATF